MTDLNSEILIQHVAFLVDGDKFAAAQEELSNKGIELQGPEDTGIALSCFFTDPDGHLLEITTYHSTQPGVALSATGAFTASHAQ